MEGDLGLNPIGRPMAVTTSGGAGGAGVDLGLNSIGRLMGAFLDKIIGPDFEVGLTKMKRIAGGLTT
jgi:hypothetical protein